MADPPAAFPPPFLVPTTLLLRRLPPAELRSVLALLVLCGHPAERLQAAAADGGLFALLEVGASPEEAVAAALVMAASGGSVELLALAVARSQRGLGLAARLLREVIDVLRSEGVHRVTTAPPSEPARHSLYEHAGFRPAPDSPEGGFELEL